VATKTINKELDKQGSRQIGRAVSNMTGSGLAGSSVIGGVEASVGAAVARAKESASARDALREDENQFRYASLAQSASEGKANRQLSLYLNRPRPRRGTSDTAAWPAQPKTGAKKNTATSAYPNIGQDFPGVRE